MQLPSHSGPPKSPTLQPTLPNARPGRSHTIHALVDKVQPHTTQASNPRSDHCRSVRTRRQGSSGHITLVGVCSGVTVRLIVEGVLMCGHTSKVVGCMRIRKGVRCMCRCQYVKNIGYSGNFFFSGFPILILKKVCQNGVTF